MKSMRKRFLFVAVFLFIVLTGCGKNTKEIDIERGRTTEYSLDMTVLTPKPTEIPDERYPESAHWIEYRATESLNEYGFSKKQSEWYYVNEDREVRYYTRSDTLFFSENMVREWNEQESKFAFTGLIDYPTIENRFIELFKQTYPEQVAAFIRDMSGVAEADIRPIVIQPETPHESRKYWWGYWGGSVLNIDYSGLSVNVGDSIDAITEYIIDEINKNDGGLALDLAYENLADAQVRRGTEKENQIMVLRVYCVAQREEPVVHIVVKIDYVDGVELAQ